MGDWGKQFGLLAVGFERYGSEEKLQENAIMHLFNVYVAINRDAKAEEEQNLPQETNEKAKAIFKAMEDGDEKTLALWKRFRDLSIKAYEKVYMRLNVRFDVYAGESLVEPEKIKESVEILKTKKLLTTKSKDESRPDWDNRRAEMKEKGVQEAQKNEEDDEELDADVPKGDQKGLALAVDLSKWKLGKPVVMKPGALRYCERYLYLICILRRDYDLHRPRHRRRNTAIREISLRQNDLCHW